MRNWHFLYYISLYNIESAVVRVFNKCLNLVLLEGTKSKKVINTNTFDIVAEQQLEYIFFACQVNFGSSYLKSLLLFELPSMYASVYSSQRK